MTAAGQAQAFAVMMLTGLLLGAAYDLLALMRHVLNAGRCLTGAADVFFGVVCAAGMIAAGMMLGVSPFRLYAFAAVLLGGMVYIGTLGTIVRILSRKFGNLTKRAEFR